MMMASMLVVGLKYTNPLALFIGRWQVTVIRRPMSSSMSSCSYVALQMNFCILSSSMLLLSLLTMCLVVPYRGHVFCFAFSILSASFRMLWKMLSFFFMFPIVF